MIIFEIFKDNILHLFGDRHSDFNELVDRYDGTNLRYNIYSKKGMAQTSKSYTILSLDFLFKYNFEIFF
jgi:hypothetical protein